RIPRHSHATADRAKLFVLESVEKTSLIVRVEKLSDDSAFAPQREKDHHQGYDERRSHDQKIPREKSSRATIRSSAVPGRVQKNRGHEPQHRHHDFHKAIV